MEFMVKTLPVFNELFEKALVASKPEEIFAFYRDNADRFPLAGYRQYQTPQGLKNGDVLYAVDRNKKIYYR
jgi:hypothetical protein